MDYMALPIEYNSMLACQEAVITVCSPNQRRQQ